jgi:nitrate reductase gamma subunit
MLNLDLIFFAVLPYLAFFSFFLVTIQRYREQSFTYSSLSSQFLENQSHFWGMVPFHYGILAVLAGHIMAFLFPRNLLLWNSVPIRLYILEISALIFALLSMIGLILLLIRRFRNDKIKNITSPVDWILFILILLQIISGIYVAIFHRWGSSWFAASMTPYLLSLIKFNPDLNYIIGMPFMVKFHIVNAYALIGFFPFTRLVHILVVPNPYLWRKIQVVRWYRNYRNTRTKV